MDKPTLPKGTRDFGPAQMAKRQFIFNIIRTVFQKYGFQPLETPAMENLETLTGKYGEEGDQLLFKILDSGDYSKEVKENVELFERLKMLTIQIIFEFYGHVQVASQPTQDELITQFNNFVLDYARFDESEYVPLSKVLSKNSSYIIRKLIELRKETHNPKSESFNSQGWNDVMLFAKNFFNSTKKEIEVGVADILDAKTLTKQISGKGLRYDLTVPFARYVVMNRGEFALPFKRYQIQPVWRADRPQRGRYREFFQCDADVVGTDSLVCEAEIVLMIKEIFSGLGILDFTIKLNHRGILSGLAELSGALGDENVLFVAIDKLDKIGEEKVKEELRLKGFSELNIQQVFFVLNYKGSNGKKLELLMPQFHGSEKGRKGLDDLKKVIELLNSFSGSDQSGISNLEFDISLARGLSYYTGTIFEVKVNNVNIGSVSGGGRYDNLTQAFGSKEKLSGVGISFGIDRLYDVMEELKLFPKETTVSSKVLVAHFDAKSLTYGLQVCQALRNRGIATEIYPDVAKLKKQLEYADKKAIPFAIVIGPDEIQTGILSFKNLATGIQEKLTLDQIIEQLN